MILPAHHGRRHADKMRPILPFYAVFVHEFNVCVVNERGQLQSVIDTLAAQITARDFSQFTVNQWENIINNFFISFR